MHSRPAIIRTLPQVRILCAGAMLWRIRAIRAPFECGNFYEAVDINQTLHFFISVLWRVTVLSRILVNI